MTAMISYQPVKAGPVVLTADSSSEAAFMAIIDTCLHHAEANRPAVRDGQREGIHQMRVAFRRVRSGLKIFRPLIPPSASTHLVADLRWLNGFLGPARDWDVFLEEGMAPIFARFPHKTGLRLFRKRAEKIRQRHYSALQNALDDPRYALMHHCFITWLEQRAWRHMMDADGWARLTEPILHFATPLLEQRYRRIVKRGAVFAQLSAEQRHTLRIRIKELRYALDFFASLYTARTVKTLLNILSRLQDCLGGMNDGVVAQRLLDEAGLKARSAARQVIEGWYGCRIDAHEQHFSELWTRFCESERPWEGG